MDLKRCPFKSEKAVFLAPWNQSKGSAFSSQCLNVKGSKKEEQAAKKKAKEVERAKEQKAAKSSDRMTG